MYITTKFILKLCIPTKICRSYSRNIRGNTEKPGYLSKHIKKKKYPPPKKNPPNIIRIIIIYIHIYHTPKSFIKKHSVLVYSYVHVLPKFHSN